MSKNKQGGLSGILVIGIVAAVTAVVIMFGYSVAPKKEVKNKDVKAVSETIQEEATSADRPVVTAPVVSTTAVNETAGGSAMVKSGSYQVFSADKIAMAATGDVVIFFHASWCPSCRGLNSDIEKNINAIPAGITILKADYDKETELKKKYGVTYQHTLVQVDKDGNMIKKWSGGSKLDNLLSEIQ